MHVFCIGDSRYSLIEVQGWLTSVKNICWIFLLCLLSCLLCESYIIENVFYLYTIWTICLANIWYHKNISVRFFFIILHHMRPRRILINSCKFSSISLSAQQNSTHQQFSIGLFHKSRLIVVNRIDKLFRIFHFAWWNFHFYSRSLDINRITNKKNIEKKFLIQLCRASLETLLSLRRLMSNWLAWKWDVSIL